MIADSLQNLVSGMGTDRDKSASTTYAKPKIDRTLYTNAFRGGWLPRKVVSKVAEDAFRKWRDWQAEAPQISALEKEEKRLKVRDKLQRAFTMARLYGVAYVYISIKGDEGRTTEPLDPSRVRRGGIGFLQVLMDTEIAAGPIDINPLSPGYGEPEYYEIAGASQLTRIHPSRLIVFYGNENPQDWIFGRDADSVLTSTLPAIMRHDSTVANVAGLVFESRVDVITVPGLADLLSDPETEAEVLRRFSLMARMKGNNGTVLLNGADNPNDPSEKWEQKNFTFSTLPDIIVKAQEEVSAAAETPRAILFGTGAGGLGSTGELELSSYYDKINTIQKNGIEPRIEVLDECIIMSALGNRPPEVWYSWSSLWQQSDKDRAETADKLAGAFEKIARAGIVPAEVMTQSVVNALTETGVLPGLEQDYSDWIAGGGAIDPIDNGDDEGDQ